MFEQNGVVIIVNNAGNGGKKNHNGCSFNAAAGRSRRSADKHQNNGDQFCKVFFSPDRNGVKTCRAGADRLKKRRVQPFAEIHAAEGIVKFQNKEQDGTENKQDGRCTKNNFGMEIECRRGFPVQARL